MAGKYTVSLRPVAGLNNDAFEVKESLTTDQLAGFITAAIALLGDDVDTYFTVYDSRMKPVDIDSQLDKNKTVLLHGHDAFDFVDAQDFDPVQKLDDLGLNFSKKNLAVIDTPQRNFVVQFDGQGFVDSFTKLANALGHDADDYLRLL